MDIEVSASILSADFGKLSRELELCERSGIGRVHIDVMDGHFVPNITIGPVVLQAVRRYTKLPIAAHLMIENPWDYIDAFADAGADIIAVQAECYGLRRETCRAQGQYPKEVDRVDTAKLMRDIQAIRGKGKKPSVVVNPGTPVECLKDVLHALDNVLVMSVNPGFSGQKFMPVALAKIAWLREQGFTGDIVVDGGVNAQTAPDVVKAGANVLVTASYFFSSKDPVAAVQGLKALSHQRAQAMLEYLLVFVVVVGIVFVAFRNQPSAVLSRTQNTANAYFRTGTKAIMGGYFNPNTNRYVRVDPAPINGIWCDYGKCIGVQGSDYYKVRECACPRPAFGGDACVGNAIARCS